MTSNAIFNKHDQLERLRSSKPACSICSTKIKGLCGIIIVFVFLFLYKSVKCRMKIDASDNICKKLLPFLLLSILFLETNQSLPPKAHFRNKLKKTQKRFIIYYLRCSV